MIHLFASTALAGTQLCGTHEALQHAPPLAEPLAFPPPGGPTLRDAWGKFDNQVESEHFVLKWGPDAVVPGLQDEILDALELAWDRFVDERGYPGPLHWQDFKTNVYVAGTGYEQGPIDYSGVYGYYTRDPEGYPMLVMASDVMDEGPEMVGLTAAHEAFHAFQDATNSFELGGLSSGDNRWLRESTATWSAGRVLPGNTQYGLFAGSFAYFSHMGLADNGSDGDGSSAHAYGAFLLSHYVTEELGYDGVVDDVWLEPSSEDSIEAYELALADQGLEMADVYADMAVRNVYWDYDDQSIVTYGGYYDGYLPVEAVTSGGTSGPVRIPSDIEPGPYGYNLIEMSATNAETIHIEIVPDEEGRWGSVSAFEARMALYDNTSITYVDVAVGEPVDIETNGANEAVLMVAATPSGATDNDKFSYTYDVAFTRVQIEDEAPPEEPEDPRGCGCSAASGPALLPALLPLLVAGLRRRS